MHIFQCLNDDVNYRKHKHSYLRSAIIAPALIGRIELMSTALVAKQTSGLVLAGPVGSLDSYIDRVSQIPVLSKEAEVALAVRFRSAAALEAARHLVLSPLRFACDSRRRC